MLLSDAPKFLTYEELRTELARFRYRPGWELTVFLDPWESSCLYVVAMVANGYDPDGADIELRIRSVIPPIPSVEYFAAWLQHRLIMIESHESREYLHRDGRPVYDPHNPVEPGGRAARKEHR